MSTKANTPAGPAALPRGELPAATWLSPCCTLEERLQRIEALGQRITGYIRFIREVGSLTSASAEAKQRAVTAFHDRLVAAENQLGRIQEELRLV
jgi:hypothetical protein